jgi:succinoglycan biosynthesis protein ExoU
MPTGDNAAMSAAAHSVCVIVAAWNAEKTIGRAIGSALAQPEVSEVVVIDDASSDATADVARSACDGTGRLRVLRQAENKGPSAARNRAIAESEAPYLAILDSDDFLVPGRFATLFHIDDWDAVVDNLAFVPENRAASFAFEQVRQFAPRPEILDFTTFIEGNISRRGSVRTELGFIKPVMRRAFLEAQGLRYDETLRLGEDYALYARMLAAGAIFKKIDTCGYVAVQRAQSLSGSHRTEDLAALLVSDDALSLLPQLCSQERAIVRRHRNQLASNVRHRRFLDIKRRDGFVSALRHSSDTPRDLAVVGWRIIQDKLATLRARQAPPPELPEVRYLFS